MDGGDAGNILLWSGAAFGAALYCLVRGAQDIRAKRYVGGALGIVSALVFLMTPIQTHAIKVDLPAASLH